MTLNLPALLRTLAVKRPIFSSEADFSWRLVGRYNSHTLGPMYGWSTALRISTARAYLDLWAADADWTAAIELKYFTRALDLIVGGERFELLNQGAQDISRYDFVRDLERVESVSKSQPGVQGYALALSETNSSYWRVPTYSCATIDAAFRLHEGSTLTGRLAWAASAGAGTTRGRDKEHVLQGTYTLHWTDYTASRGGPSRGRSATCWWRHREVRVPAAVPALRGHVLGGSLLVCGRRRGRGDGPGGGSARLAALTGTSS